MRFKHIAKVRFVYILIESMYMSVCLVARPSACVHAVRYEGYTICLSVKYVSINLSAASVALRPVCECAVRSGAALLLLFSRALNTRIQSFLESNPRLQVWWSSHRATQWIFLRHYIMIVLSSIVTFVLIDLRITSFVNTLLCQMKWWNNVYFAQCSLQGNLKTTNN